MVVAGGRGTCGPGGCTGTPADSGLPTVAAGRAITTLKGELPVHIGGTVMNVYGKWVAAGLTAALTMTAPAVASAAPAAPAAPAQGSMIVLGDLGGGTR